MLEVFDMRERATTCRSRSSDATHAVARLRRLAAEGRLVETARNATAGERLTLNGAAYQLAFPLVFQRFTRALERQRGHHACATAVQCLADDCLDRFYNDVEAVVEDILTHATARIQNLEGWVVPRLRAATVNAHRRRRGARGALQRPRLPGWLDDALGHEVWLGQLAVALLTWVGVPVTAGASPWPLDRWSELRAAATGEWASSDVASVQRDVDLVLAAMRRRPQWFANNVERPLGAKTPPVAPVLVGARAALNPPGLALVEEHEFGDSRLNELAAAAIEAIRQTLAVDRDIRDVTAAVVLDLFGQPDLAASLTAPPHSVPDIDEQIPAILADPGRLNRIVQVVLSILRDLGAR
jgi:hypothetical protein